MKQHAEIEAMVKQAEVQRLHAIDLYLLGGIDDETSARRQAFAEGAEAAILWVMGNIGDIGFPPVRLSTPTEAADEDLDSLPGLTKEDR